MIDPVAHVYLMEGDSYSNVLRNVARRIKPLGARISVMLSTPEATKNALLAAE
jgi:hypothetical protein